VNEPIPPYHERIPELAAELADRGCLGVILLDTSSLTSIEDEYGSDAYDEVRRRTFKILAEQRGKDYRNEDILCLDKPRGHHFILFLERKRRRNNPPSVADLKAVRQPPRLVAGGQPGPRRLPVHQDAAPHRGRLRHGRLQPAPARRAHPAAGGGGGPGDRGLRAPRRRAGGAGEAAGPHPARARRHRLPGHHGAEGPDGARLRGPVAGARGTGARVGLRPFRRRGGARPARGARPLCRRRALLSSGRIPSNAKIFVNTLPATIRDPQFRGKALIDFLDRAQVSPDRIVIEITEKLVIDNYNLFREAMAYFTDLGMSFAVDDVGAGYSGLEAIARLKPHYLKIDISLVRDVHVSLVNREMVKAIIAMGHGIGAAVIAEGIHTEDEALALQTMGIDWGQGYLLARPDPGPEPVQMG
jgi:hypothetical protein